MPQILYEAVKSIANPTVRNLATIGGNICAPGQKLTLYAPLLALNSRLELQSETEITHIQFNQFSGIPSNHVLTRIRVPVDEWDVAVFRRVGPAHVITGMSASYAFLANTQNSILTNLRIAFAGKIVFRSLDLENRLLGSRLPIEEKAVAALVNDAGKQFDLSAENMIYDPMLKEEFLKLVSYSFEQLT
jgi:CO/xanthine dehydrogenase FAD-binding subunit